MEMFTERIENKPMNNMTYHAKRLVSYNLLRSSNGDVYMEKTYRDWNLLMDTDHWMAAMASEESYKVVNKLKEKYSKNRTRLGEKYDEALVKLEEKFNEGIGKLEKKDSKAVDKLRKKYLKAMDRSFGKICNRD